MNLVGVIVRCRPELSAAVEAAATRLSGVEVHMDTGDGRLLITVEQDADCGDALHALNGIKGVLAASVVYHHFEPDAEGDGPRESQDATITA